MRVRALANGNVVDLPDEQATRLVDAGIYAAVDGSGPEGIDPPSAPERALSNPGEHGTPAPRNPFDGKPVKAASTKAKKAAKKRAR